jgi:hypothetical protein
MAYAIAFENENVIPGAPDAREPDVQLHLGE